MKKLLLTTLATALVAGTASAAFLDEDPLTITLNGQVPEICGLTAESSEDEIDFGQLNGQENFNVRAFFGIVCNSAGGATLSATSENGGVLVRDGSEGGEGNEISYKANIKTPGELPAGSSPGTPPLQLNPTRTFDIPGSATLRNGLAVNVGFTFAGVAGAGFEGAETTTVFAGDYRDVVTISLTAN